MKYKLLNSRKGLTFLETTAVVAGMGILAATALKHVSHVPQSASLTKMASDLASINHSAKIYLASGGTFDGVNSPQDVLDRMKTSRSDDENLKYAGFSGSMVDSRLKAKMLTPDEETTSVIRAVWNGSKNRFEVTNNGPGVAEFLLDKQYGLMVYGSENRKGGIFDYSTGDGWLTDYVDSEPLAANMPTHVPLNAMVGSGGSGSEGGDGGDPLPDPDPMPEPTISTLLPPTFSVSGGDFRPEEFDLEVELFNPNPASDSWILYSLNGEDFELYSTALAVEPDTEISAYVVGNPTIWEPSTTVSEFYQETIVTPNVHAISNIVFYLYVQTGGQVTKVKIEGFPEVGHFAPRPFLLGHYPGRKLIAYTVKAGQNSSGMGPGEGLLTLVDEDFSAGDLPTGGVEAEYDYEDVMDGDDD